MQKVINESKNKFSEIILKIAKYNVGFRVLCQSKKSITTWLQSYNGENY